jgi:hypothetical protein
MLFAIFAIIVAVLMILHTGVLFNSYLHVKNQTAISFFTGFVLLQSILAWQSIFFPVNTASLVFWASVLALLSFPKISVLKSYYSDWLRNTPAAAWLFMAILLLVFGYALSAEITLYDTGLYHSQAIKWIREYAVVPGLGNLHGRFAFNSHFFISSALFTLEIDKAEKSILLYPLNAALMLVFLSWIFGLIQKSIREEKTVKIVVYFLVGTFCLLLYPSWLNSPSPDIISAILVLLAFIFSWEVKIWQKRHILFLAAVTGTAIVVKLSSIFLGLLLIPALLSITQKFYSEPSASPIWRALAPLRREDRGVRSATAPSPSLIKRIGSVLSLGGLITIFILTPFFIRNYYLSGYLVYPTTAMDIFNPDWKIPYGQVKADKLHIATWARVPRLADDEVAAMQLSEWLPVWWQRKTIPFKLLLLGNVLSIFSFALLKLKEKWLLGVLWLNLLFWFFTAPDPRFVHGFLILGFGLSLATIINVVLSKTNIHVFRKMKWVIPMFVAFASVSIFLVKEKPTEILRLHYFYPKPMASNPLKQFKEPFLHSVPLGNNRCYNASLPCLPEETVGVVRVVKDGHIQFVQTNASSRP